MFLVRLFKGNILSRKRDMSKSREQVEIPSIVGPYHIEHVVAVATKHPYYSSNDIYPLPPDQVSRIVQTSTSSFDVVSLLSKFPVSQKEDIYQTMRRLAEDDNAKNTFRHSTYISVTGGGSGSLTNPLAFLTDLKENRAQREANGHMLRKINAIEDGDCVLSLHTSGNLYRALDLCTEIVEHAGASVLPAGHLAPPERLVGICEAYRPTILTGDTSQIVQFASYVESKRVGTSIKFDKIMYTSEPMGRQQMSFVQKVFGRAEANLHVVSVYGSAETGVWAFGNSAINIPQMEDSSALIFDSKHMIVEVVPLDFHTKPENRKLPCNLEFEKVGSLVVTSLQRLRNPLVRYFTGDIGSVHLLPDSARSRISGDSESLRVLRLYGRDARRSISWQGEYFDLSQIQKAMSDPSWGILQWQVVADHDISHSNCESLEVRLMRADGFKGLISLAELTSKLKRMFCVHELNEHLFHTKMASSEEFIRSDTGNKVIRFVEKRQ